MDFFISNVNAAFDSDIALLHIALPLGISFFTITQIAFLIDCYHGLVKERNPINYALFVTFFPHLIAGPILHHKEMMPQFANTKNKILNYKNCALGLFLFAIGLFKKIVIADSFAKWANAGFSAVEGGQILNIFESWATSLSYTFQLYFDFSGYCDMAVALGLLFNIKLPINFSSPYKALNITDFWRRWHITLGRFLKSYLYIPLGGNRNVAYRQSRFYNFINKLLTLRNLFIVAFISGIWHGAGFGFVIWGCLHGLAMVVHRIYGFMLEARESKRDKDSAEAGLHGNAWQDIESVAFAQSARDIESIRDKAYVGSQQSNKSKQCRESKQGRQSSKDTESKKYIQSNRAFRQSRFYKILCWLITFNFINITWIFFRAENLQGACNLLRGMFGGYIVIPRILESIMAKLGMLHLLHSWDITFDSWAKVIVDESWKVWGWILGAFIVCLCFRNAPQQVEGFKPTWLALIQTIIFSFVGFLLLDKTRQFLYFNF